MSGKHKRSNEPERQKARQLVSQWYSEQCSEGRQRYGSSNVELAPEVAEVRNPGVGTQNWKTPLTARGTQSRTVDINGFQIPHGEGTDPFAKYGNYQHNAYIVFIRECMAHVMFCCIESHHALEMQSAGWGVDEIAEQLGCSEPVARDHISCGLTAIISYRALRKPRQGENDE